MNATGIVLESMWQFNKQKNDLSEKKKNYDEDFASFATCWFSTLAPIFGHVGVGSHKKTRYK